jgi:hypothetical protein
MRFQHHRPAVGETVRVRGCRMIESEQEIPPEKVDVD